jgi:hypothetical protein
MSSSPAAPALADPPRSPPYDPHATAAQRLAVAEEFLDAIIYWRPSGIWTRADKIDLQLEAEAVWKERVAAAARAKTRTARRCDAMPEDTSSLCDYASVFVAQNNETRERAWRERCLERETP